MGGTSAVVFISLVDGTGVSLDVSGVDDDSSVEAVVDLSKEELPCSFVVRGVNFEVWVDNTGEVLCSVVNSSVGLGVFDSLVDTNIVDFSVVLSSVVVADE